MKNCKIISEYFNPYGVSFDAYVKFENDKGKTLWVTANDCCGDKFYAIAEDQLTLANTVEPIEVYETLSEAKDSNYYSVIEVADSILRRNIRCYH